jgi:hypothetical protein
MRNDELRDAVMVSVVGSAATFSPGRAVWNHRELLSRVRDRMLGLSRCVGRPTDLQPYQFAQLLASCLEFQPDLILELGRGYGNSTCAFTEAANLLGGASRSRVLSLCNSGEWDSVTAPKLRQVVDRSWFRALDARRTDILTFDYDRYLRGANRIVVFWDAHGFEIAECVLGTILPLIANRPHLIFMHDLSDIRYCPPSLSDYGGRGLWKGENAGDGRFRIGIIDSAVAQAISILDFSGRNGISLDSADHSMDLEFGGASERIDELRRLVGDELFSLQGHWFWFTLNERPGPYTFPTRHPPTS